MERLRHAWTYWEASALKLRFQQWNRFVSLRRVRHAQHRVFIGLQQRLAVRRWLRYTHTSKHDKRQVVWASQLFYESSVGWYFRAWRCKFESQVHKRLQAERAVSHLIGKGLRGYFERWRATYTQQKHNRQAMQMADLHLDFSRQRRAVRWLREHVQDHHDAQTIWHHVKLFFTDHAHRRIFTRWKTFVVERKTKLKLQRTAAIHFGGRTVRVLFSAWMAYVTRTRYLKARLYRSRHLYFSSLYSRSFFRLRRFATLKRRLRHVTHRVTRRRRQEWFDRWKQFGNVARLEKKRSARAFMLYRKSHVKRLFSHWRSVAVERWMRQWLVNYAGVVRRQGGLALAVRRWWTTTEAKRQAKAQGWRLRQAYLVSTAMEWWRHVAQSAKKERHLAAAIDRRRQSKAMNAWLDALLAAEGPVGAL
ncbi:hypothetical protein DYB32_001881 [Aphanomyces invadans]|uniref:Sfi1 spindle body domain-containing protein n=1 Tax=Aphanomyces invadans TaxID=157072 RepID=A0A3R6YFH6_9STRA|nr:hypothetical protein DYB32_001881 [Aphanomyces invadans]